MQFLQHWISTDASMPCHHTGCCTGDASIYTWRPKALYLLHMSICGSWQISASTTFGQNSQLPMFDWIPARDSLPDQMICAHCGSVHSCLESLRKHIIYGHCHEFDANRAWTRNGDEDIVEQLRLGRVDLLLADREVRKRLTPHCQFCAQTFSQACNLISHLFHQHGDIAQEAETFQHVLQQRYAPRGCYCMPPVRLVKTTHQCVEQHINVLRSYNWAWCTTMETIFSPSLWPMIPVPMTEWILIFHCHIWTWFMIASRLVTLPFFNRIPLFVGPFVIDAYAVERKWHWLVLPRNTCYDITYKPVTQSPGTSLTVWFKWWYTESKMITCRHVIGVVITLYLLMPGPNMMIIWLNAQHSCILQLGLHFRYILCPMEIQQEDIPMQMLEVLGNMALDYGASNGHVMKKRRDQPPPPPSRTSLPDSDSKGANSSKMVMLMANLLLRHEQDLMALQSQNRYVLFLSTNKEGMIAPLLQESTAWKTAQQQNLVDKPLRQHLCLFLLKTRIQRVTKLKESKSEDPVWISSIKSQLVMQMAVSSLEPCQQTSGVGWEETQHTHGRAADPVGNDSSSIGTTFTGGQVPLSTEQNQGCSSNPMEARDRCEKHLASSNAQRPDGELGVAIDLTTNQTQSRLADELMKSMKQKWTECNYVAIWWPWHWSTMMFSAMSTQFSLLYTGLICFAVILSSKRGGLTLLGWCNFFWTQPWHFNSGKFCGPMVRMAMVTFWASFWGGLILIWLLKRFKGGILLMQGLSSRRKAADMPPFSCILNCGLRFLGPRDFRPLLTVGHRWMGWPRHLSLPQNLCVFSFADFNPWRLQTGHLLTLAIFAYIWQNSPMIRYPQHVSHTELWLLYNTMVTRGVAITPVPSPIVIPMDRRTGCTMMTTGLPMCGVKSLKGSHGTSPMYGWFVQIVSWSGMFHLQPHQPKTLLLEIKPWNRSWRVWYDSFTSVRCDCDFIISRLVYFRWTYCMAPVLGCISLMDLRWVDHISWCDVLFASQAPTLYCLLIMLHGPCLSFSVYVSIQSFQWNFCCKDATSIWRFLTFWRCLILRWWTSSFSLEMLAGCFHTSTLQPLTRWWEFYLPLKW